MQDSILSATARVLGADPLACSWYSQGGSSMQAAQLISSVRAMGHHEASMADLLEAEDVVAYLSQFDAREQELESATPDAEASPHSADLGSGPPYQEVKRRPLGGVKRQADATASLIPSAKDTLRGGGSVDDPSVTTAPALGPEATFLLKAATQAGIGALVALMDACLQLEVLGDRS